MGGHGVPTRAPQGSPYDQSYYPAHPFGPLLHGMSPYKPAPIAAPAVAEPEASCPPSVSGSADVLRGGRAE